jgi:transcription antitermination factor NusG
MAFDIITILNIIIASLYAIFLALFAYETKTKNRSAPYLLLLLVFGVAGGFLAFIDSSEILPSFGPYGRIYLILELVCYGLQFFFFYLFIEDISSLKPRLSGLMLMLGLLVLQNVALWSIVWFSAVLPEATNYMWLLADIGYVNLPLVAFLIFGLPTYYRIYRYTEEKKALGFMLSMIITSLGFIIISLIDYIGFFGEIPVWLDSISLLGEIFPLLGLLIFLLTYLFDVDYIYRLPSDHYLLMITYRSGVPIHFTTFETKKEVEIEENLFSGFISSIGMVFEQILRSSAPIESISSKEATIVIRSGKHVMGIILTKRPTSILARALDTYIKKFEKKYEEPLKNELVEVSAFEGAEALVKPIFPFFQIKDQS